MIKMLTLSLPLVLLLALVAGCSDRQTSSIGKSRKWIIDNYLYIENMLGTKAMLLNGEYLAGIDGGGDSEVEVYNDHRRILRGRFIISFKDGTNIEWIDGEIVKANDGSGKYIILK
jgi:hypothetical protein